MGQSAHVATVPRLPDALRTDRRGWGGWGGSGREALSAVTNGKYEGTVAANRAGLFVFLPNTVAEILAWACY